MPLPVVTVQASTASTSASGCPAATVTVPSVFVNDWPVFCSAYWRSKYWSAVVAVTGSSGSAYSTAGWRLRASMTWASLPAGTLTTWAPVLPTPAPSLRASPSLRACWRSIPAAAPLSRNLTMICLVIWAAALPRCSGQPGDRPKPRAAAAKLAITTLFIGSILLQSAPARKRSPEDYPRVIGQIPPPGSFRRRFDLSINRGGRPARGPVQAGAATGEPTGAASAAVVRSVPPKVSSVSTRCGAKSPSSASTTRQRAPGCSG